MKSKTKISKDLKFKRNPRKITDVQLELLRNHLSELGDLSGVIYCHNNKAYVGGNQRSDVFDNSQIEITERFSEPTKQKTLAHGFIVWQGEKYAYREVAFTENEFKKACIVANHDGGTWDMDILRTEFDIPELVEWGFEVPEFETVQIPQEEYQGFKEYKQIIGNPQKFEGDIVDDPMEEYKGMPEFKQETMQFFKTITVNFLTEEDYKKFSELIEQNLTTLTKTIWYPKQDFNQMNRDLQYES